MAAQAPQEVEPDANVVEPAAHVAQLVELAAAEKVLAPHCVHEAAFAVDENEPAGQAAQLDDVALKNVPGAHVHVRELPEPDVTKPGLHAQLLKELPAGEVELAGQALQVAPLE